MPKTRTKYDKAMRPPQRTSYIQRVDKTQTIHGSFNTVNINIPGGNVVILPGKANEAHLTLQWTGKSRTSLRPHFYRDNETVHLTVSGWLRTLRLFKNQKNAFIVELTIPPQTYIQAYLFAGTIHCEDVTGDINAHIATGGEITGTCRSNNVYARLGAGNIHLTKLHGNIRAQTYIGNIMCAFAHVNSQSIIHATNYIGDVWLAFSPDIIVSTLNQNGTISNYKDAEIYAHTKLGDVRIMSHQSEG